MIENLRQAVLQTLKAENNARLQAKYIKEMKFYLSWFDCTNCFKIPPSIPAMKVLNNQLLFSGKFVNSKEILRSNLQIISS